MAAGERNGRRWALITGASAGIGAAFAGRLARDGYDLILVARRGDRLNALGRRLTEHHGTRVDILVADLSVPAELHAVEERVAGETALQMLVNNAGHAGGRRFADTPADETEAMIRVHVVALVRLTRAALPGMIARGEGTIINVASTAAFQTDLRVAGPTYVATKAYVNAFTQTLHHEVGPLGVRVQALCPGWVRTEILGEPWPIPEAVTMTPEELVDASLAGLTLGEVICQPPLDDPTLLAQLDALKNTIFDRVASTGTSAPRYGVSVAETRP